jgi:hypothetical protein
MQKSPSHREAIQKAVKAKPKKDSSFQRPMPEQHVILIETLFWNKITGLKASGFLYRLISRRNESPIRLDRPQEPQFSPCCGAWRGGQRVKCRWIQCATKVCDSRLIVCMSYVFHSIGNAKAIFSFIYGK